MRSYDSRDDELARAVTGINVTPLVDVTLVLLIIFLVTAKLATSSAIPLDVPQAARRPDAQPLTLAIGITTDGTLTLDGISLRDPDALARAAQARAASDVGQARAVIAASTGSRHGAVIAAVDALRSVGITRIAFKVERDGGSAAGNASEP